MSKVSTYSNLLLLIRIGCSKLGWRYKLQHKHSGPTKLVADYN